ncbi:2-oxoglutarate-acceptor oxidoreductase subunit OorD [bacterium BMS3Bbin06]|nr:2-oxoglutarate-acceptor oxidoreductase subunit OorD [bacterium BMS3Abin08]GBE34991.1 2-oxoglutarate-acceptor oxidoreductase subunit OorD [bacterium BMS3Bbin06]HDH01258.1 ferredoxin family protein [Nitrospirota bacterium]HDO35184.1 ferredoxin family protein [Nitrospirota bacterium]HDY70707.1 ferredoxin family protein [Nitrospirota bacterium]
MKGKIEIDKERCKSCSYCIVACPKKIIILGSELNSSGFHTARVTDGDKCNGCTLCAESCPEVAIEVWRYDGGKED